MFMLFNYSQEQKMKMKHIHKNFWGLFNCMIKLQQLFHIFDLQDTCL